MRRNNMVQAFVGEPDPMSQSTDAEGLGYDEVKVVIKSGVISAVVPSGTPDGEIWNEPRVIHIELITEDGQQFTFEVNHGGDASMV